jgi:hypothetical protein
MKKTISVQLCYIHNDDILKGYIILHENLRPAQTKHLDYVRIKCEETNKTIFCRVFGPGTQGKYYEGIFKSVDKEKHIFLDAYYRDKLKIKNKDVGQKTFNLIVSKENQYWLGLLAAFTHPEIGIKVSAILGFISILLG